MSDLRTRIAVVLADNVCTLAENAPCTDCVNSQRPVADAVIRELTDWELIDQLIESAGPRCFGEADSMSKQETTWNIPACSRCLHRHQLPNKCGAPITQDIRVGNGTYDPVGRFYRSIVVDTCHCTDWKADDE